MTGCAAIQEALRSTHFILGSYLKDLADADLLVRPVQGANHTAWQLGHLIASERGLVTADLPKAAYPELPTGFAEAHSKATANSDGPAGFRSKAEYLGLLSAMREATITVVGGLTDADLDRASVGPMAKFAPTLAALFILVANHTLMHGGQVTVLRRKLGKPVVF